MNKHIARLYNTVRKENIPFCRDYSIKYRGDLRYFRENI